MGRYAVAEEPFLLAFMHQLRQLHQAVRVPLRAAKNHGKL